METAVCPPPTAAELRPQRLWPPLQQHRQPPVTGRQRHWARTPSPQSQRHPQLQPPHLPPPQQSPHTLQHEARQRQACAPSSSPPSPHPVRAAPGARETLHVTKGPLPWCPGNDASNSGSARHTTTRQQRVGSSGSSR